MFMKDASLKGVGVSSTPTDTLPLTEVDSDIFLDIFTQTYSVIAKAISRKIRKN